MIITTPTAPAYSTPQAQKLTKTVLTHKVNDCFRQMMQTYAAGMEMIWTNANGLTPQQSFDALGTDAGESVRLAGILKTAINAAVPNTITTTAPDFTTNENGTVTVS